MPDYENAEEVVVVEEAPIALIEDDRLLAIAENAAKRVLAMRRIIAAVLELTSSNDWVDEGGKPYLQGSGAEKVARMFGVVWQVNTTPQIETDSDGHYTYTFEGTFGLGNAEPINAIGTRSSRDGFFSVDHGRDRDLTEINRGDVKKAAVTNLRVNGISQLLGLRNLTWEDLAASGITPDKAARVDRSTKKIELTEEGKKLKEEVKGLLMKLSGGDPAEAKKLLLEHTAFEGRDGPVKGKDNLDKVSENALNVLKDKLEKLVPKE